MQQLYSDTALACSKLVTERYSTSFTLGIKTLHKRFHEPIFAIYGFVRFADEIVDTFHDQDKATLLQEFKEETYRAIDREVSFNPVLHSFQWAVNKYEIEQELIDAFLHSMSLDLNESDYDENGYKKYIYGSAEVVGLMCLRVFCEGDEELYQRLKEPATRLGSAFQKVNFLRDLNSDYQERGRMYFPDTDFDGFDEEAKRRIESDIQQDFDAAKEGIRMLPKGARFGVYLAFTYYQKLFHKIRSARPETVKQNRLRIPNVAKWQLLVSIYLRDKLNLI